MASARLRPGIYPNYVETLVYIYQEWVLWCSLFKMEFDEQEMLHPTNLTSITTEDTTDLFNIISELGSYEYSTNNSLTEADTIFDLQDTEERHQIPGKPYVAIVEEPATNLYRFRYRSEGETAGSIPGEKQQTGRKSFPKIMVCNYEGLAALEVCCLTEDLKVHPNKLVRKTVLRTIISA